MCACGILVCVYSNERGCGGCGGGCGGGRRRRHRHHRPRDRCGDGVCGGCGVGGGSDGGGAVDGGGGVGGGGSISISISSSLSNSSVSTSTDTQYRLQTQTKQYTYLCDHTITVPIAKQCAMLNEKRFGAKKPSINPMIFSSSSFLVRLQLHLFCQIKGQVIRWTRHGVVSFSSVRGRYWKISQTRGLENNGHTKRQVVCRTGDTGNCLVCAGSIFLRMTDLPVTAHAPFFPCSYKKIINI